MRFSNCLVLGLMVALLSGSLSGCSHCEKCRNLIEKRFGGRGPAINQRVVYRNDIMVSPNAPCACGSEPVRYELVPPVASGVSELNAPIEPGATIVEPETPIDVPELPSSKLKENGGPPRLKGTIEPAKDDTGFRSPMRLTPRKMQLPSGPPQVVESPMLAPPKVAPANEPDLSNQFRPLDGENVSILEGGRKSLKVLPASSVKESSAEPRVIHESLPVPVGVFDDGQADEVPKTQLPAVSNLSQPNVVLQARPDPTPLNKNLFGTYNEQSPQHLSVADASSVDGYGLPNGSTVPFQQLPPIQGTQNQIRLRLLNTNESNTNNTNESKFEEPPLDNQDPNFQSLPVMSAQGDPFTSATSYQAPMRDETFGNRVSDFIEVQNSNDRKTNPNDSTAILTPADSVFRIVGPGAPPVRQVQILRLRAATPLDQTAKFPPIVSISVGEPIIVRGGIHPDAMAPIINVESPYSTIPSRPMFDEKRLEASIRGLTARPDDESTTKPNTIER